MSRRVVIHYKTIMGYKGEYVYFTTRITTLRRNAAGKWIGGHNRTRETSSSQWNRAENRARRNRYWVRPGLRRLALKYSS